MLLESLTLDSEAIRLALTSVQSPASAGSLPALARMLDFVERAAPPTYWASCTENEKERQRWEKMLGVCKGVVIKAIVTLDLTIFAKIDVFLSAWLTALLTIHANICVLIGKGYVLPSLSLLPP